MSSIYRSDSETIPLLDQPAKTDPMIDGVNMWFFAIGVALDKSVSGKDLLNWFHIFIDYKTMGLEVRFEMGFVNRNLEHSRAFKEVKITDALSRFSHSASVL